MYALTAAEADIAVQLTSGRTPDVIAASRNVAVGTVRSHISRALATLHPAYLLRTPSAKRMAWRDLLAVKAALQS